jgi:serine/threonine protein phosphatase PrpC
VTLSLRYGARSDVGLLREGNEDAMYAGPRLLAVADGMGGHAAGEVASRVVIETVSTLDEDPPDGELTSALQDAVQTANGYLRDMVAADGALEGMGTTLTALLWVGQQLGLAHVGDSRGYLLRDGNLEMITHDHTLVQNLIDEGRITPDEATTHPQRSWITRALDGRQSVELDLSVRDVRAGDRYLLCSDGLSSYVSEDTIAEALGQGDPQEACDRLVDLALRAGGPDNVTCIVADLVEDVAVGGAPIMGGAAGEAGADRSAQPDSPATRAAAVAPPDSDGRSTAPLPPPQSGADDSVDDVGAMDEGDDDEVPSRGGGRRLVLVLALVVIVVVGAAVATFVYVRSQYYVGVSGSDPATVAVYRGVSGSFLGVDLSRLSEDTNLPVDALPDFRVTQVDAGMQASSAADAERIVGSLRTEACDAAKEKAQAAARDAKDSKDSNNSSAQQVALPSYCAAP